MKILDLTSSVDQHLLGLVELLQDSINSGASVGFLTNSDISELLTFWRTLAAQANSEELRILGAFEDDLLVGTVSLLKSSLPNGRQRAEVKKLLVHSEFRSRGLGTSLMQAIEITAKELGLKLLVLDSETHSTAESLYKSLGWNCLGSIPNYALSPDGNSKGSTFFWKFLEY